MLLQIKKISNMSIVPIKGSEFAAGYDLYSTDKPAKLQHAERKLFKTGICVQIPHGYYGRIAPRSGLALKQGIDIMAGIIDSDYTGEIGVILINLNNAPITINTKNPIAQLIIEKYFSVTFKIVDELTETKRGSRGFGSSDE